MGPRRELGEGGGAGDARAEPLACGTGLSGRTRCTSSSCLAGPVRERGEGRPSGPAGKEKEREGGTANGLWAGFQFHCFSYFHFFSNSNHSDYLNSNSNLNLKSTLAIKQK